MRRWRKLAGRFLPRSLKNLIARWGHGFRPSQVPVPFYITESPFGLMAEFFAGARVRITPTEPEHLYAALKVGEAVEELSAFAHMARAHDLLFDVGAHTGAFSLIFCASGPRKRAVAYEPSNALANVAIGLAELNEVADRLTVCPVAIGGRSGELPAFLGPTGFVHVGISMGAIPAVWVKTVTLDDECDRLGQFPGLVKIDVEGYEYEVLCGARRLLNIARPVLFLELHLDILEQRGTSPEDLCTLLANHGYRLYDLVGRAVPFVSVMRTIKGIMRVIAQPVSLAAPEVREYRS